MLIAISGQQWG